MNPKAKSPLAVGEVIEEYARGGWAKVRGALGHEPQPARRARRSALRPFNHDADRQRGRRSTRVPQWANGPRASNFHPKTLQRVVEPKA